MTDHNATVPWRRSVLRALDSTDLRWRNRYLTAPVLLFGFEQACAARIPVEPLAVVHAQPSVPYPGGLELEADVLLQCGWGPAMAVQMFRCMMDAYPDLRGYTFDTLALLTREQLVEDFGVFGEAMASALVNPARNPVFAALIRGQYGECSLSFVRAPVTFDLMDVGICRAPTLRQYVSEAYDYSALLRTVERLPLLPPDAAADYYYKATGRKLMTHVYLSPNGLDIDEAHLQAQQEVRETDHAR